MKRACVLLAFALLCLLALCGAALADTYGDYEFTVENNGILIDAYTGTSATVNVPQRIQNKNVLRIGDNAFAENDALRTVSLPYTVEEIGSGAFENCVNLSNVSLPVNGNQQSHLHAIHSRAFAGCDSLESLTLPAQISQIESGAFDDFGGHLYAPIYSSTAYVLSEHDIRFSETGYPEVGLRYESTDYSSSELAAYAWDDTISSVEIPAGVTRIGSSGFEGCNDLTAIEIPAGVTHIGDAAFRSCGSLESVTMTDSVLAIEYEAFADCGNLSDITLSANLTSIDSRVFAYCGCLESLALPDGITETTNETFSDYGGRLYAAIGSDTAYALSREGDRFCVSGNPDVTLLYVYEYDDNGDYVPTGELDAYAWDDSIESVEIPAGVTRIAENGFEGCNNLTEITIPAGVTRIREGAFHYCQSLETVTMTDDVVAIEYEAFADCGNLSDITLSANLTSIDGRAFADCGSLESLALPDGITETTNETFSDYGGHLYAAIGSDTAYALSRQGDRFCVAGYPNVGLMYKYDYDDNGDYVPTGELDAYAWDDSIDSAEIPEGAMRIAPYGFEGCNNLTAIEIPAGVTWVGENAFHYCQSLETVTMADDVLAIDGHAFYDCSNMTDISLSQGLEYIGNNAFYGCSALESITIPDSVTEIANDAFEGWNGTLYANVGTSGAVVSRCRDFRVEGYDDVYLRYEYAYSDETGRDEPTGEVDVFALNTDMTTFAIPEGVTRIGEYGFQHCNDLTEVVIPEGVKTVRTFGFWECASLASVTLPSSFREIEPWGFDNCYNLTEIVISEGLERIDNNAFDDCPVTALALPESLRYIGCEAFVRCNEMPSLTVPDGVTELEPGAFNGYDGQVFAGLGSAAADRLSRDGQAFSLAGYPDVSLRYAYAYDENTEQDEQTGELAAFAWNKQITTAQVPAGATVIDGSGFQDCDSLTTVVIPEGVTEIRGYGFQDCDNLVNVTLPSSLTVIGSWGFDNCWSLTALSLNEGLERLENNAFDDCPFTALTLPESLRFIGAEAFKDCNDLPQITIPAGVTEVDTRAFEYYYGRVYTGMGSEAAYALSLNGQAFSLQGYPEVVLRYEHVYNEDMGEDELTGELDVFPWNDDIVDAEIPSGVTRVPEGSFRNCANLGTVVIPDSVTAIADDGFPMYDETLVVGCTSYARSWAVSADYPRDTEATDDACRYTVVHRDERVDAAVEPTCTETGLTEGLHCDACAEVIVPQTIVDALGHDWGAPVYAWAEGFGSVTANRVCGRDASHTETEIVQATSAVAVPATCEEMGQTTYTSAAFANAAFEAQSRTETDIPALGHAWGTPSYSWASNGSSATATRVCGNDANHVETETVQTTGTVTQAATCTARGKTKYTATFTNPAFTTKTKTLNDIPALGHAWGTPTYVWAADNASVTATRVCGNDASHTETETAATTSTVTRAPTCEVKGRTKYTATFTNSAFTTQTKTLTDIPALGHAWGAPSYTWADDGSSVTATRVCANDAGHTETETAVTTSTVTQAATCTAKGKTKYTAAFTNAAFTAQTKTLNDIPALGHAWGEPAYTWAADNASVTATRVCANDASHVETETVQTTSAVARAATCEAGGETEYTAAFTNAAFAAQTKTLADIPALGHAWGAPAYTWADDNSSVTAARECANDAAHVETETVRTTWTLVAAPTETTWGERQYASGAFANAAFAEQARTVADIPALGELSGLKLPAMTQRVEDEAFAGGAFEYVIVPDGCTYIGSRAFAGCESLIYIKVPAGAEIAADAFEGCGAALVIDR